MSDSKVSRPLREHKCVGTTASEGTGDEVKEICMYLDDPRLAVHVSRDHGQRLVWTDTLAPGRRLADYYTFDEAIASVYHVFRRESRGVMDNLEAYEHAVTEAARKKHPRRHNQSQPGGHVALERSRFCCVELLGQCCPLAPPPMAPTPYATRDDIDACHRAISAYRAQVERLRDLWRASNRLPAPSGSFWQRAATSDLVMAPAFCDADVVARLAWLNSVSRRKDTEEKRNSATSSLRKTE